MLLSILNVLWAISFTVFQTLSAHSNMHIYQGWPNFFMCVTKWFQDTKRAGRRLPTPPYNYLNENKNLSCLLLLLFGMCVCYFEGFIAGGFCIMELCQNTSLLRSSDFRFRFSYYQKSQIALDLGNFSVAHFVVIYVS